MSIHLVQCASRVAGIPQSGKLILLCLAEDSRDASGRRASPGLDEICTWSNLSKSRAAEVLKYLIELRLIEQVGRGQKHRNAEYLVFPDGCCEAHGMQPSESDAPEAETTWASHAQQEQRRRNAQQIANIRRLSASDAQEPEQPVDTPTGRSLRNPQPPTTTPSASDAPLSASDRPEPSPSTPLRATPPEVSTSPHSPDAHDSWADIDDPWTDYPQTGTT